MHFSGFWFFKLFVWTQLSNETCVTGAAYNWKFSAIYKTSIGYTEHEINWILWWGVYFTHVSLFSHFGLHICNVAVLFIVIIFQAISLKIEPVFLSAQNFNMHISTAQLTSTTGPQLKFHLVGITMVCENYIHMVRMAAITCSDPNIVLLDEGTMCGANDHICRARVESKSV